MEIDIELLKSIYRESPIGIELYDSSGKLVDTNRSCLDIFGIPEISEVRGFDLFEDPNLSPQMRSKLERGATIHYEAPFDFDLVKERGLYKTAKKGLIYLDVLITPLRRDGDGARAGYLVQVQDITTRKLVEEELSESEDKFRGLVEQSSDGIVLVSHEGVVLDWNRAQEEITGLGREEVLGKYLWDVQHKMALEMGRIPPDYEQLKAAILESLVSGESPWMGQESEQEILLPNGERRTISSMVFPIQARAGFMIAGITRDITDRKRYEESLWKYSYEVQERLKELNCLYGIARIIEQPGVTLEDILGQVASLLPSAWRYPEIACARIVFKGGKYASAGFVSSPWKQSSAIIMQGEEVGSIEVYYREERLNSDGELFPKEEKALLDAIAERLGRVSERLSMVKSLRESEEEFRLLAENARDFVFRVRLKPERHFEYVSPSATAITGYSPQEYYSDPDLGFKLVHPEDRKLLKEVATGQAEGDKPLTLRWIKKDGSIIWAEQRNVVIYDDSGEAVAIEGIARDVTERRKTLEELERINKELEIYANVVSHDLRGPISLIISAAGTISEIMLNCPDRQIADQVEEVASLILRSSLNAVDLINSILSLARAGQVPEKVSEVDVEESLRRVLDEKSALMESKGVRVSMDDELGRVMADPTHIYQLFSNLIANAIEYNDSPEPRISVSHSEEDGIYLYRVCDNGSGIPPDEAEKLFLPLYRGKGGGTGLGLAIVKRIVEIYGGHIRAYNREGTCFEFTIKDLRPVP
jgi:PAS domain S-box-containing protein